MTGRPSRWGLVVCVAVVLSVLTGCAQKDDGVDKTLTIDQAKHQTQAVTQQIIDLVPSDFVALSKVRPEGILLACSPTSLTWSGGATLTVQSDPDFTKILTDIQTAFTADPAYTTIMDTDYHGDPVLTIHDKAGSQWIVSPMTRGATLDVMSSSPCFLTPDGMQPSDSY